MDLSIERFTIQGNSVLVHPIAKPMAVERLLRCIQLIQRDRKIRVVAAIGLHLHRLLRCLVDHCVLLSICARTVADAILPGTHLTTTPPPRNTSPQSTHTNGPPPPD